jgi:hypothetical protein
VARFERFFFYWCYGKVLAPVMLNCVRGALAVVDREGGAPDNLAAHDIQLAAIFKRSDFLEI